MLAAGLKFWLKAVRARRMESSRAGLSRKQEIAGWKMVSCNSLFDYARAGWVLVSMPPALQKS